MGISRIFRLARGKPESDEPAVDAGPVDAPRIAATLDEGVWRFDTSGCTTFVNERMARLLGATSEQLVGAHLSEFFDPDESESAQRALRDSENQLRRALDAAHMGIWEWDIGRDHIEWSANVHRIFDLPRERTPATLDDVIAIIAPQDRERVSREIREVFNTTQTNYVSEYQVAMQDGAVRWFESRGEVERDATGRPVRMRGTLADVTSRKQAEIALRESEGRLRTLAEAAFEGIAITEDGCFVDLNNRLLDVLKLDRADLIGTSALAWFAPESVPIVEAKLRNDDPSPYEAVMLRADGSKTYVEIQGRWFTSDAGRRLRVAAIRDVTARRQAAELLQQSRERELRAREEFSRHLLRAQEQERQRLANELHDGLGQNLSLVKNRMYLAMEIPDLPAALADHLKAVAQLASDAIAEVRSLAQNLRPIQIEQLGLTASLRSLIEQVRDSTTTQIDSRLEDIDEVLQADAATHLYRIVQEALNNILKHAHAQHAAVALQRDVGVLRLDIRDDGVGFVTGNGSGGGLGLTSMGERAQMLGGTLTLESAPGAGTYVQVNLPFTEPAERE